MNKPIYALSIKQPWAWLICKGYKDIENRDWRIGREPAPGFHRMNHKIELPARIYIHAGLSKSEMDSDTLGYIMELLNYGQREALIRAMQNKGVNLGFIIGEAAITDCVTISNSPWFVGKYGFVFKDPVLYDEPLPCRGMLGFFKPEISK